MKSKLIKKKQIKDYENYIKQEADGGKDIPKDGKKPEIRRESPDDVGKEKESPELKEINQQINKDLL